MGTSLSSIHIFGDSAPIDCSFSFRSFSPNWQTCINDFSEKAPDYPYKAAKYISKHIDAPVLHFGVFDSEMIWFDIFYNGKIVSKYSDDELVANKKLFDIPSLIGYGEGHKKRLSSLLSCSDIDLKIAMLEEYLGVCLLYLPELDDNPQFFHRDRNDTIYRKYQAEEKALTGKAAPIHLKLIAEYPGKLFSDFFNTAHINEIKPHYYLYGYAGNNSYDLTPVCFVGEKLEESDLSTFSQGRICVPFDNPQFKMHYGTPCKVTFSDDCPPAYRGKTMTLPNGFFPYDFTNEHELLLEGNHRIYVVDPTLKIIAKLSIKGDIADIMDDYVLTTTGDSFCGYCFEPKAKIYIYKIVRSQMNSL